MKVYLAGPISGQSGSSVFGDFEERQRELAPYYEVLSPLTGKGEIRNELKYRSHGYDHPLAQNHAIIERDRWMVSQADVIYINLMHAERVSIGSMMELAWAHEMGKHSIVAMPKEGIHNHAFVLEAADVVYHDHRDAMNYLIELAKSTAEAEIVPVVPPVSLHYKLEVAFSTLAYSEERHAWVRQWINRMAEWMRSENTEIRVPAPRDDMMMKQTFIMEGDIDAHS